MADYEYRNTDEYRNASESMKAYIDNKIWLSILDRIIATLNEKRAQESDDIQIEAYRYVSHQHEEQKDGVKDQYSHYDKIISKEEKTLADSIADNPSYIESAYNAFLPIALASVERKVNEIKRSRDLPAVSPAAPASETQRPNCPRKDKNPYDGRKYQEGFCTGGGF